jgi:hypothetical protein
MTKEESPIVFLRVSELEFELKMAREEEREACAKVADDQWVRNPNVSGGDAIRARGQP